MEEIRPFPRLAIAWILTLGFSLSTLAAQTAEPGRLPPADAPINDHAAVLSPAQRSQVQALIDDLAARQGAETVVVTIGSIRDWDSANPTLEAFATRLFNDRGIGDPQRNDGVLLLLAVKDREVRIELGSGYGRSLDARMGSVIETRMVPQFRRGDYGAGVVAGLEGVVGALLPTEAPGQPPKPSPATQPPRPQRPPWFVVLARWALILGFLGFTVALFGRKYYKRHRRRNCPECARPMHRLSEIEDDEALDPGQRKEEALRSVDYDVWRCDGCNHHDLTLAYPRHSSPLLFCPECGYKTMEKDSVTVQAATYDAKGTLKLNERCQHCDHLKETLVTLPKLVRWEPSDDDDDWYQDRTSSLPSTTRSSSSSSSSSSSRSWSRSSSRSSSGGRSSGGRSSGGGASGRW